MSGYVLGLDIGGTKIALATADVQGRVLRTARIATAVDRGAHQALERAVECALALMAETDQLDGAGTCRGFAVVAPGVVRDETMVLTPNLPDLGGVNLRAYFERTSGVPCLAMGNDVKAAAMAETRWGSLRDCDPALYVNVGTGVAAAIVSSGRVLPGAHGAAGEIAYLLDGGSASPGVAAGRAPLEELVGGRAIAQRASALLGEKVTTAQAFAHPDPRVQRQVEEVLDTLSLHIANSAILLDPQRISLGGGLMGSAERVIGAVARRVRATVPFPPDVVPATFLRDAPLRGALALAVDAVRDVVTA